MWSSEIVVKPIVVAVDEVVAVLAPRHDGEGAGRDEQPGEAQPHTERRRDHRLVGRSWPSLHQPGRRRVEAQSEGEQDIDGEVDPQDLQRQQRRAVGDVEDPGARGTAG